MSAEMKASVLLTLGVKGEKDVKAASNALKDLATSAKGVHGAGGLGTAAKDADLLSKSASKAAIATADIAGAAKGIGTGFAAAAKDADALAAAANRASSATTKVASAAKATGGASGKDTILYGGAVAQDKAAKTGTPLMAVKGADHQKAAAIAGNLERANPALYAGPKGAALLEKHVGEQLDHAKASGKSLGGKAMDAYFGLAIGQMAVHGVDHIIGKSADVSAMREKIKWSLGGDKKGADAAYAKAVEMSGKYKNTSVVENLHIIDDLRANLPESMEQILAHSTEPFIKMHGFFKAWAGGKHAGTAEKSLQAIGAAIRSGELTGAMSGEALAKHAEALSDAQVVFGDKFSAQKYLQGTQKAATALASSDDNFKYTDFPVLLQRLNDGGAVALRGLFDKAGAGNKVAAQSAEAWRALDLVDMNQVETTKAGKIKGSSLLGKDWLKGAGDYRLNMTDAIMTKLVPALAKHGGLKDLAGLDEAWKAGDVKKIASIMEHFRHDKANLGNLAKWAAALAKDPKAGQAVEELILGAASIQQDRQRMKAVQKDKENFTTYDKSKQEVGAQADRLMQAISGEDLSGNIGAVLSGLAGWLGTVADDITAFKAQLQKWDVLGAGKTVVQGLAHTIAPPVKPGEKQDWGLAGAAYDWLKGAWTGNPATDKTGAGGPPDLNAAAKDAGKPGDKADRGWGGFAADWLKSGWKPATDKTGAAAGPGPMGPEDPNAASKGAVARFGGRYQPDDGPAKTIAAGPEVPTLVGGAMADGAAGAAPAGITIQANGPQVSFNQAPPNVVTNVTVNVTTNASPGEIGAAAASAVSGAASRSGALHDGAH